VSIHPSVPKNLICHETLKIRVIARTSFWSKSIHSNVVIKYYQAIKSKSMRWAGPIARVGSLGTAHKIVDGKPEGKTTVARLSRVWE
jgi:hypothetical protein